MEEQPIDKKKDESGTKGLWLKCKEHNVYYQDGETCPLPHRTK